MNTVTSNKPDEQGDIFEKSEQSNSDVLNTLVSPKNNQNKVPKIQSKMMQYIQKDLYKRSVTAVQRKRQQDS